MTEYDLKPCPFCGEHNITTNKPPMDMGFFPIFPEYVSVQHTCANGTSVITISRDGTVASAVDAWNTRIGE